MKGRYKKRVSLNAWVMFSNDEHCGYGHVVDLTAPGCQIDSTEKVTRGEYLELRILLPGQTALFTVRLAVVRWTKGTRFGAEFIRMDKSEQQTLDAFMAEHLPPVTSSKHLRLVKET
jgi:hypothetical protein